MLRAGQQRYDEMLDSGRLIDLDPNNAAIYNNNMGVALLGTMKRFESVLSMTLEDVRPNREALLKAMEATQDIPLHLSLIHPQSKGRL